MKGKCRLESRAIKRERVTWGQRAGGWKKMLLIKKSSKPEHRYRLVVKLKAIKYKENFLCYLFFTASYFHSPWMPTNPLRHFSCPPVIWNTYNRAHNCDGYPIGSSFRVLYLSHTGPSSSTRPSPTRPPSLPSPPLIGNYSAVTPTHQIVWWMVEADVDVLESWAYAASS